MCTLTEPPPGIFIDWLHPDLSVLVVFGAGITLIFSMMLSMMWSSPDTAKARISRKQAMLFILGGYVCLLLCVGDWAFVESPSRSALEAWNQHELAVLTEQCAATVLAPAYHTADTEVETWWNILIVPSGLGFLCVGAGAWLRGQRFRGLGTPGWG